MAGRQVEHGGSVLEDERALDLAVGATLVDQALDETSLAVRLWGVRDGQRDFAGDAHHLAFDRGQCRERSKGRRCVRRGH